MRIFRHPPVGNSLRSQLLLRFALVLLLVVTLTGVMQAVSLRKGMRGQLQELLASRLHNVPVGLLASLDTKESVRKSATDMMKALIDREVSILILDENGEEMADSEGEVRIWYNERLLPRERTSAPLPMPRLGSETYREILQAKGFPESRISLEADGIRVVLGFVKLGVLDAPSGLIQLAVSSQAVDVLVRQQLFAFGFLAIGALALGGGLAASVLCRTLKPLQQLNEVVEAQKTDALEQRISEDSGQKEVDSLSRAYNRLLARLKEAFSQEQNQHEGMRRFLSDVAHELKTPLTSIHGFAEVLLMGAAEDEEQLADALEVIRSESERLGTLVQGLLDLANLEQGAPFQKEPEDLVSLVSVMNPQLLLLAGIRRVELDLPGQAPGRFQKDRIRQVILNLFQNAVAHTDPEHGTIRIAVQEVIREGQSGYCLSFSDNGCGIPMNQLDHVFDRFWRADVHRSRKTGGNGLGLSIVKSIAGMHGGCVHVESEVGSGSVFSIWIPST